MSPRVFSLLLAFSVLTGCAQTPDLFASGRDGRSFNAATGRYEWGEESAPQHSRTTPPQARPAAEALAESGGREFNPVTRRFE